MRGAVRQIGGDETMELTDTVANQQMVRFRIDSLFFLTPVSTIDEVADPVDSTPLPATHAWFKGLATLKGQLIPVSDLGEFCGVHASARSESAKWLVINDDTESFAVIVDEVLGLVRPEEVKSLDTANGNAEDQVTGCLADLITGNAIVDNQQAMLVDLRGLIHLPAFVAVGSSQPRETESLV